MNTAAMIIGIIWGLILALHSIYTYYAGKIGTAVGIEGSSSLMLISFLVPILVLIGAGMSKNKPLIGGVLMLIGALLIFYMGGVNGLTVFFALPILIAGVFALLANRETPGEQTNASQT